MATVCKYWKPQQGCGCITGDECGYVHSRPSAHPCKYFISANGCDLGHRCRYVHDNETRKGAKGNGSVESVNSKSVVDDCAFPSNNSGPAHCKYFAKGGCKLGDKCEFTHQEASVDNIGVSEGVKCKYFARGVCKLGDICKFSHRGTPEETSVETLGVEKGSNSAVPCKYHANGFCKLGDRCSYAHISSSQSAEVIEQRRLGAQSCRGVGKPDLSPLGSKSHAERVFKQMLRRESALAGEWAVFYHSYNSPSLLYEVQAAVAKVLFRFRSEHGSLPGLLKSPFEKLPDASAVLKDHNPAFKSVGICCSTSLVSHDPEATPISVFLSGYGASRVGTEVVEKLLTDCGAGLHDKRAVPKLALKIKELAKTCDLPQESSGASCTGHLLQIFIRRCLVDRWAYASHPYGVLDEKRQPFSKHLASNEVICGQARVVANPSAFMRARSVRLYTVSADESFHKGRAAFQKALEELLSPILGSSEVREIAAKGIYGGKLPSWWRDLATEEAEAKAEEIALKAATAEPDEAFEF